MSRSELEADLRRYDPLVKRRPWGWRLSNGAFVSRNGSVKGDDRLARGLVRASGEEALEDLIRVFVPGVLLPAELATLLQGLLPAVVIREDPDLGLFWFDNDDPDLTVSAHEVRGELPPAVAATGRFYVCGIDDARGPSPESAERAFRIAEAIGGTAVDRYGFRVTEVTQITKR
ncbi:hypothetical protein [Spirillospora sp. NPDC047279]|uniref:hypothetical protein n=1 Tax=Spirillospora sp. NPDC047279 TaxID=3155478 RepID=UPI0033ED9E49